MSETPPQAQGPLLKVAIEDLRPTQLCVGMLEVADKTAAIVEESKHQRHEYLEAHPVPTIRGPGGALYLIDHHHLARALVDAGYHHAWCSIIADLSAHSQADFWKAMQAHHWVYLHDAHGHPQPYTALPKTVAGLVDDPYRSLAGAVRKAGGYTKTSAPFAEFQWADFLRSRIKLDGSRKSVEAALDSAVKLAHGAAAAQLPGFIKAAS